MKKLMRFIAAAGLCTLLYQFVGVPSLRAQAQGNTTNAQKLEKLEALSKQLKLTPEQKEKLLPILKAEAPKMEAIKNDTSLTKLQKAQKIRALHEETNPKVQAILSPEQFQQLQEIRRQEVEDMIQKKRATQQ